MLEMHIELETYQTIREQVASSRELEEDSEMKRGDKIQNLSFEIFVVTRYWQAA